MTPFRSARLGATLLGFLVLVSSAAARQAPLALEDLYHPQRRLAVPAAHRTGQDVVTWLSDATYLQTVESTQGDTYFAVDAVTGDRTPLFAAAALEDALSRINGVTRSEAAHLARQPDHVLHPAAAGVLVTVRDDLYWWRTGDAQAVRLTDAAGTEHDATFSPDGQAVAFTRDFDLYVVDLAGRERRLTSDGHEDLRNGRFDWLYQEEIYGRGRWRGFWWSPDSKQLAFLPIDQRHVPKFPIADETPYRQHVEVMRYPKAGDPNPIARLGVVPAAGGPTTWADLSADAADDRLVVRVSWTPDAARLVYQVQDREQRRLDLYVAPAAGGKGRRLFRETTPAWVVSLAEPVWLADGSFLWLSERNGWAHLYRYRGDGTPAGQLTAGEWDVRTIYGVSPDGGSVYLSGTERSAIGLDIYRVALDGSGLTRLSQTPGTHDATFSPAFTFYAGRWSDVRTPPQVRIHRSDGTEVRVVERAVLPAVATAGLAEPEFLQVTTRDGFAMEALLMRPPDFDPQRRYPVYQHTYGGPGAPQVRNAWGGTTYLFHQLLASQGIVVWICDNRSASGKGAQSAWPVYGRLGELELQDIEDGLAWLRGKPWVDERRIGLNGWSYGGFVTMYALTHSRSFAMGIAGGGVSDWRDYDTVYTERYMRTPERNPEGYRRTAPRWAADRLSGRLLLLHGLLDDNVHAQNTLQFAYELQRAGTLFELMLYPRSQHAITEPELVWHQRRLMVDFILRTLEPARSAAPAETP